MTYELVVRDRAVAEMQEAFDWYESQVAGLGGKFLAVLTKHKTNIQSHPFQHKITYRNYREIFLQQFPYLLVNFIDEQKKIIVIVSVFHCSRNPKMKFKKALPKK